MKPTEAQLNRLYELIQEHQQKGEPLIQVQMLGEGFLRITFAPTIIKVGGRWYIEGEGIDLEYNIDRQGNFI